MSKGISTQETKTPIEIALQIDENGMTTASNLYSFLELDITHFSRWCNKNIVNNKFAIENEDYFRLAINGEREYPLRFKTKTDYKLTSDFAKKLSMTGNTERHEQARQYFITCETGLKIATQKLQSGNQLNIQPLTDAITTLTNNMIKMQQDMSELKQSQKKKSLLANKYSRWKSNVFSKFKLIQSFTNDNSDQDLTLPQTMKLIFDELQDTYDIDLSEYTEMYKCEYGLDFDTKVQTLDVINHYKGIRDMFTLTLDSILEKLHLENIEDTKYCCNIFDELAEQLNNK